MGTSNKIGKVIGITVGATIVGCIAVCLCGTAVSLTIKLISWLF